MPLNLIAFAVGVWVLQQQAQLPSVLWAYGWLAFAFVALLLGRSDQPGLRSAARPAVLLVFLAAGFVWAGLIAQVRLADALPSQWEGRDVTLIGVVAELPQESEQGVRFRFEVETVLTPFAEVPDRLALAWYREGDHAVPDLSPGQRWQLTVRLRRPHGTANPHGFDFEVWLLERGIRATGYVRAAPAPTLLQAMVHRPRYWVERLRQWARARIRAAVPDVPSAGVLVALAIGDQQAIAPAQWTVFTRTGVNHLMSISGLHITMVSGLVFAAVSWGWRRLPTAALRFPAQKAAAVAGLAAAFSYALLAGFAVPAQRTVYMLTVVATALLLGRTTATTAVLAAALFVVLLLDPWAVLAPGFWLSFGAVALILYVGTGRLRGPGWALGWVRAQWAITVGLVPLLLVLFQQVSLVSPIANAIAIPVVSLGVVPLTLLGLTVPIDLVLALAAKLMTWCALGLELLAGLPEAVWEQQAPPAWTLPVAVIGAFWLLAPRGFPARWLGAAAMLPPFLAAAPVPAPGSVWVDVLDVGQGLAAVVRTHGHALVFDTGPAFSEDADSGARIVAPHLRAEGVRRIDGLILSHDDIDHIGGARSLMQALPVGWVAASLPAEHPLLAVAKRSLNCYAGQRWEWDAVRFEVLHPTWPGYNGVAAKDNDRSCVLRVVAPGGSVLLTADIERKVETQLLQRADVRLASDVLVVPHHGSATSSSDEFITHIGPRVAIVPVGYRNRFRHPAEAVVWRYAKAGVPLYRTDHDGAVHVRIEQGVSVRAWRSVRQRYWQEQ